MGTYTAIVRTGNIGGTVAGAMLTDAIGHRLTLSIFSALIAVGGGAWFFATRTRGGVSLPAIARTEGEGGLASVLRDRRLLIVSASGMVSSLVFAGLVVASIGFYLRESYGSEVAVAGLAIGVTSLTGLLLGVYGALNLPVGPASGLISDRLGGVQDPLVQRMAPKLISALDRAIRLCADTLKFGRAREAEPVRAMCPLKPLVEEAGDGSAGTID